MTPYDERGYKEILEEALEDLYNGHEQSFREKIMSLHNTLKESVDKAGINRPHPYVEQFTHPDLKQ
tara:strand:+ start:736 stop:933 length:198 start_codon:yes stop_codon:yes gene_type:complete